MQVTSKNIGLLPDGRYTIETNLQVRVTKSKASFIFRYQFAGRRRDLSLGSHPTVTVTAAKQEGAKCRALLARHRPFRCQSRASRRARQASARLCKLRRARARNDLQLKHLSEATKVSWRGPMKNHILPVLRHKLVADITVQDICEVLDPLWERRRQSHRGSVDSWKRSSRSRSVKASTLARIPPLEGNLEAYFPPPARVHRREHQRPCTIEALADQLKAIFVSTGRAQCFRLRRPHRHATSWVQ